MFFKSKPTTIPSAAEALPGWLKSHKLPAMTVEEAANSPLILERLDKAVKRANKVVSQAESIRKYEILPDDLTIANGYLTPSLKVKRNLVLRTRVSSLSETRRNGQMVLAALTYSSVIWVVLVVVGAITSRLSLAHVLTPRFGLMLLGSFLYMLISMSIALLACAITQKQNVITGVTNVVALGSSFLGGVFVPVEVLGEGVLAEPTRVVRAEEELASGQHHADVRLRAAAIAAVGCGERGRCRGGHDSM